MCVGGFVLTCEKPVVYSTLQCLCEGIKLLVYRTYICLMGVSHIEEKAELYVLDSECKCCFGSCTEIDMLSLNLSNKRDHIGTRSV